MAGGGEADVAAGLLEQGSPTLSAICRIWIDTAGWVRQGASAAREKLPRRATVAKVSSWREVR
jgi:hypothetical protein